MKALRRAWPLLGPSLLAVVVAFLATFATRAIEFQIRFALVYVAIVVALYLFVGNSGVISFGHSSFVAVGAYAAGIVSISPRQKGNLMPDLFPFLAGIQLGNLASLVVAALLGGLFALLVGVPLMRLSGLAAGIATFAVLGITRNLLRNWTAVGPGVRTLTGVPETTGLIQGVVGAIVVMAVAFTYQRSRPGRRLRAAREDPLASQSVGINTYRERLWAFTLSGLAAGLAGGLLVHLFGSITTDQVYLELTFITLAMLVVGGTNSLWGAVIGTLGISFLNTVLSEAEKGLDVSLVTLTLAPGTRPVVLGLLMASVLLFRPSGITRGREAPFPFSRAIFDP